jgi:hypothetical protein
MNQQTVDQLLQIEQRCKPLGQLIQEAFEYWLGRS